MSSKSRALSITPRQREAKAEKMPRAEALSLPAALLLAAETTSQRGGNRPELSSVFLHSHQGRGRVVGTDGNRLFVGSFALPEEQEEIPSWLSSGVLLSNADLKARVSLLLKLQDSRDVRVSYAKGAAHAELSDALKASVLRVPVVAQEYPNYEVAVRSETFATLDGDGEVTGKEWEPIGINSQYLKHCGDIAKVLEAGLAKEDRSKTGMVVRAFNASGDATAPLVFDFSSWPGAILVMMPARLATNEVSQETAALLAPAVRASIAALRAHATRWIQRAEATESETEKAAALAKSQTFQDRVAELMKRLPGLPALEADKPEGEGEQPVEDPSGEAEAEEQPEPKPEAESGPTDEPADEPSIGPVVTRTRIVTRKHAA